MRKLIIVLTLVSAFFGYTQDVVMQNGTFNRCAPDKFFDSGGEFANYSNNENLVTTICPQNTGEFIILDFLSFSTQLGLNPDYLNVYDGDDTAANLLGTFQGPIGAFTVSASNTNTSGCLTLEFVSALNDGTLDGWEADILCATACQDIVASIDTTTPEPNATGVISILPGETVDFSGSATFSVDGSNATYNWDFGDGTTATGTDVSHLFPIAGTYTVTFTATDENPQGCTGTETITVFVLGPNVVVDQDLFTPEELIEDVLVNSPCASVSNISWSTGINFGPIEPNGIGYFFSDGINFPFEDGVLLTSGDASRARGPNNNALSEGTPSWEGDMDLNNAVGITSNNATFIQFDFVPLADNISFEFLMASEEYNMGSFECNFSDAFAFLLTDSMGNTTNLAVLPGTNTPILVTNIHLANSSCPAINEQYFGGYTPQNGPPISFDGRTTVFTAQSAVNPGETYTIKLVIADASDTQLDSGVFLKAGSFDLGGDLGEDITIAAGTARCDGSSVELDTGVPTATHTWYFEGNEIPGESGSIISVSETGTYSVDVIFSGTCQSFDSVFVEFIPNPTNASSPVDLFECSASGTAEFDLSQNDANVLGTLDPTEFIVSYHLSEQDAIDNVNPLPTNYTNTSNPQTIYVRLADLTQTCFDAVDLNFVLSTSDLPSINPVADMEVCDDGLNDGTELFNLESQTFDILGAQDPLDYDVTYHLSFVDADGGVNALSSPYPNTSSPQGIWVRVETISDATCYSASANPVFNLIVNPRDDPSFSVTPTCDGGIASITGDMGGTFAFDILPTDGAVIEPVTGAVTGGTPGETYSIAYTTNGICPDISTVEFTANPLPVVVAPTALEVCDDGTPDGLTEIDLEIKNDEITGNNAGYAVSYHFDLADAVSGANALAVPYDNISNPQTVFVRVEDTSTGCYDTTTLELVVEQAPVAFDPEPLRYCDPDNDGFG
ncbi:choice-of-anchor L domain-containing protein, partial [Winogradskyella sp. A2]|uniref:choice-of-anchor L domain-containing protein n=1 Tax=Winogradskyella sp. A2 TaxID=3366944 RepID=UPI00398C36C6